MGATVNTLAVDKGDLLALEQARRNVLGKCKVKSLTLTTRESKLATYIVNANFTRLYDNYTGIEVNTRVWKRVWTHGYPTRVKPTQVTWVLYRHYGTGRLVDSPRVTMKATLVDEGLWEVSHSYAITPSQSIVDRQWNVEAANELALIQILTPATLVAAGVYAERYGRNATRLVTEQLPHTWNEDFKRAVNVMGGWMKI